MSARRYSFLIPVAAALWVCVTWWPHIRNEFFVILGSRNEAGGWYGFNSGAGGAFYMGAIPAGLLFYWHRTCHVRTCLRLGRHPVEGTGIVTCRKHHPVLGAHPRLTAESILHLHREQRERTAR